MASNKCNFLHPLSPPLTDLIKPYEHAMEAVLQTLIESGGPVLKANLYRYRLGLFAWNEIREALRILEGEGKIVRSGRGKPGDPYRFAIKR
jgi:hypothetical protein